jgi:hypothetical protein
VSLELKWETERGKRKAADCQREAEHRKRATESEKTNMEIMVFLGSPKKGSKEVSKQIQIRFKPIQTDFR